MSTLKTAVFLVIMFLAWSAPISDAQSTKRIEIIAKRFTYDPGWE
jgi:hypothetical protein